MKTLGLAAIPFVLLAILSSPVPWIVPCRAQSAADPSATSLPAKPWPSDLSGSSYKVRPLPQVRVIPAFSADVPSSAKTNPLEYRAEDQMTDPDRALSADSIAKIREAAVLAGMDFDRGKWSRQQLQCRALPGHVFLVFQSDNGPGDVSLFSAAIPRGGSERVVVIPIERRGYSLFSPAPVNAMTVAAFNRIRAGEPENPSADWLATALCYAALAGARPAISATPAASPKGSASDDLALAFPPTLEIGNDGESTVRFVDVATQRQPSEWALTFSAKGQLLRVVHFATPNYAVTPLEQNK
jgi:hypothetical protein